MKTEILINSTEYEKRLAMLEDDKLVELQVERPDTERMVGDIYKAKIKTVLPGMQAAFVDIGMEKAAYLHASDVGKDYGGRSYDSEELDDDDAPVQVVRKTRRAG
ncbi:MAG: Rne/Rng family ribonuclease, partial [candidate division Zixibacteria bacterium]|nr:Rne/Rng family ribonuclease [candidate division Zixibacteria bacterium]